ncbi:MAG TPA: peptidoglycan-binding protein [Telluria sp.]|nr:peptidoglycan-binding protein [Telluria sp.]
MTLKKLSIVAYSDSGFTQNVGTYTLQINPATYKQTHTTQYTKNDATDAAGVTTKFYTLDPQRVTFEFHLDATGVVQPAITSVSDEISKFKTVAYSYNGSIHSPNYLELVWGAGAQFNCRLVNLDIDYLLFRSDGTPIRAKLNVTFEQYLSPTQIQQGANKSSPDLTHARVVVAGDTLPAMCARIYGDSKYYLGVAAYNGLTNFRKLAPGRTLYFPPLEK